MLWLNQGRFKYQKRGKKNRRRKKGEIRPSIGGQKNDDRDQVWSKRGESRLQRGTKREKLKNRAGNEEVASRGIVMLKPKTRKS